MDTPAKKRLGATVALLFLSPGLVTALSGCNRSNCDDDGSTLSKSDDCGTGGRSNGGGRVYSRGGGGSFGPGQASPRSGGFGGFGRFFSGGG